jgi:hypothetical protein
MPRSSHDRLSLRRPSSRAGREFGNPQCRRLEKRSRTRPKRARPPARWLDLPHGGRFRFIRRRREEIDRGIGRRTQQIFVRAGLADHCRDEHENEDLIVGVPPLRHWSSLLEIQPTAARRTESVETEQSPSTEAGAFSISDCGDACQPSLIFGRLSPSRSAYQFAARVRSVSVSRRACLMAQIGHRPARLDHSLPLNFCSCAGRFREVLKNRVSAQLTGAT